MSPGIAASAVSRLNLHFTELEKSLWLGLRLNQLPTWVWLARSFCIPCMSLIFSLKNHVSGSSFHWYRIKEEGPTPVTLGTEEACCLASVCALYLVFCHLPLHLKALCACYAGSPLQGETALPALRGCRGRATPLHPNFILLPQMPWLLWFPWWSVVEGRNCLAVFLLCAAPGIWVLTRPGHVGTAIVQTISSDNCILSGSGGTLQSQLAGQRKALLCEEKCLETASLSWVPSAQLFVAAEASF